MTSDEPQAALPPAAPEPAGQPEFDQPLPSGEPDLPPPPPEAPTPPPPVGRTSSGPRKGLIGGLIAAGVIVAGLAFKYVLPLVLVGTVSGAIGAAFGGPFERLPEQQRRDLDQRFMAAIGDSIESLPEAQQVARASRAIEAGLPRLGDDLLVERFTLGGQMLETADVPTCARMARAVQDGIDDPAATEAALAVLPVEAVGRWFEINVTALEAEAAGSPAARTLGDADVEPIWGAMFELMSDEDLRMLTALGDPVVTDADACGGLRALYRTVGLLPADDIALMARYDISP